MKKRKRETMVNKDEEKEKRDRERVRMIDWDGKREIESEGGWKKDNRNKPEMSEENETKIC